jgi:hypothetical protein
MGGTIGGLILPVKGFFYHTRPKVNRIDSIGCRVGPLGLCGGHLKVFDKWVFFGKSQVRATGSDEIGNHDRRQDEVVGLRGINLLLFFESK